MVVSENVSQAIDNHRGRLVDELPIRHFLIDLRNENVLNDDDVDELEAITPAKKQNDRFIRILVKRDDEAFKKFCNLLLRNQATAIQNLGRDLLQQVNIDRNESILQVIENNRSRLVNDLPIKHLLIDLRNERVLNDDDVDELEGITPARKQNDRFIRILVTRGDEAFYKFCNLLARNQANAIKNLARDLLQQVNNGQGAAENHPRPQPSNQDQREAQQVMEISDEQALQALQTCGEDFIRVVPVDDLLFKLEMRHIISNRQKNEIRNIPYKDDRAEKLFDILSQNRTASDFMNFCKLLQEFNVTVVQQFGNKLLSEARSSRG